MKSPILPELNTLNGDMAGQSKAYREVLSRIERVAPYYRTALITGETGTGKELAARLLHGSSRVAQGPFVALNCSAVVETLFESELFGHVRGAFTDASRDKLGMFELAHRGTLFLDEIGDMPLATQAKLLRVLQNQEVMRVGSLVAHKVDVHIIAATNKNLRVEVAAKRFREDLYYRLSMLEIEMPPLRNRKGDVPILAAYFGERWSQQFGKPWRGFSTDFMSHLEGYPWPGNIRELENVVGHACMMADGGPLDPEHLPNYLNEPGQAMTDKTCQLALPAQLSAGATDVLEEYERRLVIQALDQTGQNQARAARILRTSRDRLRYKMKKYGLIPNSSESALFA